MVSRSCYHPPTMPQLSLTRVHLPVAVLTLALLVGCAGSPPPIPSPTTDRVAASPVSSGSPAPRESRVSIAPPVPSPVAEAGCGGPPAFIVPGSHGTVGGWLVDFASER